MEKNIWLIRTSPSIERRNESFRSLKSLKTNSIPKILIEIKYNTLNAGNNLA